MGDVSTSDFDKVAELIQIGELAARKLIEDLKSYSVSVDEYKDFLSKHRREDREAVRVDFVKVEEPERVAPQAIKERIKTKPGIILDTDVLQGDLTRIYTIGDFEQVDFKLIEEEGKKGLLIDTKEKPWGPNYVRFGLNLI